MRTLNRIIKSYDNIAENVVAILYASMIFIMFSQVILRYIFDSPRMWAEELSRYMFVWIVYIAASIAISRKAHLEVDYFIRYLPKKFYIKYVKFTVNIAILGFLTVVMIKGVELANKFFLVPFYTISFLPQGIVYMAVPVGSFLMFINLFRNILKDYTTCDIA